MKRPLMILILGALLACPIAWAMPAQVLIIRHAEKPDSGDDLSERGDERAQGLVRLFKQDYALNSNGTPTAIYAAAPSKPGGSVRSIQTVAPLADSLGLAVRDEFVKWQVQEVVDEILSDPRYDGKTVLICWEHNYIPDLAQAFGAQDAPAKWAASVYDRVWKLSFAHGQVSRFENLPQDLLPGDSTK